MFNDEQSYLVSLSFNGVERFLCNSLREGNIVLDVSIISDGEQQASCLKKLYQFSDIDEIKAKLFLASVLKKLENNLLFLLKVSPSYGCEIMVLCESFTQS